MDAMNSHKDVPQVLVRIPSILRNLVGDQSRVIATGNTVRDLIDVLDHDYPGLRFRLCYETGELRTYVNIFLNRENIRSLRGLDTPLFHGATLHILPSVAGG